MADEKVEDWNIDARTYLTRWVAALSEISPEFDVAMKQLTAVGCDPLRIAWLANAASGWVWWRSISKNELNQCAEVLRQAAGAFRQLFFSQANFVLGLESMKLAGELADLSRRTFELVPTAHARRPIARDAARAALVRYVRDTTKEFHDDAVAALLGAVEQLGPNDKKDVQYTAEAHIQWRNRSSCQELLEGPAAVLIELEAAMNRELAD